jgi:AcrR family transcriptional regulator
MLLEPRKSPVQARSNASVQSILEATVQVLLSVGKERLTTTRVAHRAGVSVGTLYQYFPNKSALLKAVLRKHLEGVTAEVEHACQEMRGAPLEEIVTAMVNTFLGAKLRDLKTSMALHSVSSDVEGAKIAQEIGARVNKAIVSALATAREPLAKDLRLVASTIQAAMVGVGRSLLEGPSPEKHCESARQELILMLHAYLRACIS